MEKKEKWHMRPEWILCRGIDGHHSYEPLNKRKIVVQASGIVLERVCAHCGMLRELLVKKDGSKVGKYKPPAGYLQTGERKFNRRELTMQAVKELG